MKKHREFLEENKVTNKTQAIRGNFDFIVPAVVPSFPKGEDAEALYNQVRRTIKSGVWYDADSKTMQGSSTFLAARVDSILRPKGIRVATLADLSRPEIMEMVRGNHYSDTPAIVFRTMKDGYEPNKLLINALAPLVEEKAGRLELPVLVTGFDVVPSEEKKGYGLRIVPRKDFAVLHDERLSGHDGDKFSNVDERGLPNFESDGSRIWYARTEGLSGLCLCRYLDLDSGNDNLAGSYGYGRVVLVRDAVAGAQKKAK
jgi:hypothetical protein